MCASNLATDTLYTDPKLVAVYDNLNAGRIDHDFYLSKLPPSPAQILDIGCGTGSFALTLADLGHHVTALDPAPEMIRFAQAKPNPNGVLWRIGTARDIDDSAKFDLVFMTGHAFQCLLHDHEMSALFQDVARLLAASGSFWFETRNHNAKAWLHGTPDAPIAPIPLGPDDNLHLSRAVIAQIKGIVTFKETYHFQSENLTLTSTSSLRFADNAKIEALAEAAALPVSETFGDWTGASFQPDLSPEVIFRLQAQ